MLSLLQDLRLNINRLKQLILACRAWSDFVDVLSASYTLSNTLRLMLRVIYVKTTWCIHLQKVCTKVD